MDPDLVAAFAAEYVAERNHLAATKTDTSVTMRKELAKVIKDQDMLVNAILAVTPAERIKDRMAQLELRQKQLEKVSPPSLRPQRPCIFTLAWRRTIISASVP